MNTITIIIHNPSILYSDVQFAVSILFSLITDLASRNYPMDFMASGDWETLAQCVQDLYLMHIKDQNITLQVLRDLALSTDFSFDEKEQMAGKLIKLMNRTHEGLEKLSKAREFTYNVHHQYHAFLGSPIADVPYLHHPQTPNHILVNQANKVILRQTLIC